MNTEMFIQALIDLHDTGVLYEKTEERERMSEKQIIEVTELEEHEDGSATIQIETSPDITAMLVGMGLQTLVKKAMRDVLDDESGM